jgi:hypothetical protein
MRAHQVPTPQGNQPLRPSWQIRDTGHIYTRHRWGRWHWLDHPACQQRAQMQLPIHSVIVLEVLPGFLQYSIDSSVDLSLANRLSQLKLLFALQELSLLLPHAPGQLQRRGWQT